MRLSGPAFRQPGPPVGILVDGQPVQALAGESLAAAMTAAGLRGTGPGKGRERAPFCGMGVCQDCVVQLADAGRVRACLTPVVEGMVVATAADPWSARIASPDDGQPEEVACDVLVVGAGPAGLAAACTAREAGADVIVADERPSPGGQYFKPLAPSQAFAGAPADRQYMGGLALTERACGLGVALWQGVSVWGAFPGLELAADVAGRGAVVFRPRRLVLATGAHEWVRPVPGWTLPGVMTTGAAQTLLRAYRVAPGRRVLVGGCGPLNLQVAAELAASGVDVAACIEEAPAAGSGRGHAGALARALAADPGLVAQGLRHTAALRRAGVPVLHGATVVRVLGEGHATGVEVAPLGRNGPTSRFEADAICLNHGFLPNAELALQLGARASHDAKGAALVERDGEGRLSVPGAFLAGDGAGLGGARAALAEGEIAGRAAAAELGFQAGSDVTARRSLARHRRFQAALWRIFTPAGEPPPPPPGTVLCRCEGITFGAFAEARAQAEAESGGATLPEIKRRTRLGMGPCQGRYCLASARRLCSEPIAGEVPRSRPPSRPVSTGALAAEKPEWVRHRRTEPAAKPPARRVIAAEEDCEVAIIGAGVVGLCLALELARAGIATVVLDGGAPGSGASGANAGSLHVQLQSHLARLPEAGRNRAAAILPLSLAGVERWSAISAEFGGFELRRQGGLMLAATQAEATLLRDKAALEQAWGLDIELLEGAAIRRRFPFVAPGIEVASFCPAEGMVDPLAANRVLLRAALAVAVRVAAHRPVTAVERSATGWRLVTDRGALRCRRMVLAAGPSAGRFARDHLGLDLPLAAAALHMNVTEPAPPLIAPLIEHGGRHLTLKQLGAGNVVIGGGWPGEAGEDGRLHSPRASIEGNLWVAQSLVPALAGLRVIRTWTGLTTVCEDDLPLLGELPGLPGAFVCVTHTGYTLGPICARLLAERMCGRANTLDVTPFLAEHRASARVPAPVTTLKEA
jgi:glycine/D-amino acid oxidase-like deaminating enzyme